MRKRSDILSFLKGKIGIWFDGGEDSLQATYYHATFATMNAEHARSSFQKYNPLLSSKDISVKEKKVIEEKTVLLLYCNKSIP